MLKKIVIIFCIFLTSCGTIISTGPNTVDRKDANRALNVDLGVIIDVVPIKIRGEASAVGAVAGGIIGGLAGQKVGGGIGQDIAIVAGTVAGGVIGYFSTVKLGEHNGFQYTIVIDETKRALQVIQGQSSDPTNNYKIGDRVTIVYGNQVKVLPTKN